MALWAPDTSISISLASMTVPTPTVSACFGTWSLSSSKNLAFAAIVSALSVLTLVLETRDDPGSLKAMWPSGPMPPTNSSMPPLSEMAFS
jgi:hypothetical protein